MIKDKEYPATHSMSTAWFAIDKCGNVAMIDFDDNGPIPNMVPEDLSIDDVLTYVFKNTVKPMPSESPFKFTRRQLKKIISVAEDGAPTEELMGDDVYIYDKMVVIDKSKYDIFLIAVHACVDNECICLSKRLGVYIIGLHSIDAVEDSYYDTFDSSGKNEIDKGRNERNDKYKRLATDKVIIKHLQFSVDVDFMYDSVMDKDVAKVDKLSAVLPFYIYKQHYCDNGLIELVVNPKYHFKESQLSPEEKRRAIRLPFKFKQKAKFRIDRYYEDCRGYETEDDYSDESDVDE
jgi:hypothetical protein